MQLKLMIRASVLRRLTSLSRNVCASSTRKAALAESRAVALLSVARPISFCRTVRRRRQMRTSGPGLAGEHARGEADQLRAHDQTRSFDLIEIDLEAYEIVSQPKGDHPSTIGEAVRLADGQDAGALQSEGSRPGAVSRRS